MLHFVPDTSRDSPLADESDVLKDLPVSFADTLQLQTVWK